MNITNILKGFTKSKTIIQEVVPETCDTVNIESEKKTELVLKDGRFAAIYEMKAGHMLIARMGSADNDMIALRLILQLVKIDEKRVTIEQIFALAVEDYMMIVRSITQ